MSNAPKNKLAPDAEKAARFLQWLSPSGPHRIETIASEGKAPLGVRTFRDNQAEELAAYIADQNSADSKRNTYFLPNAAYLSGDRKKENVHAAGYLHADLDAKDYPGTESEQLEEIVALLLDPKRRPEGIPQPTAVCFTGGGYQAFWKLAEPVEPALAEELNYSLLVALGGGLGTHNVDRLMRLSFTVNWLNDKKRNDGREPAFARFIEPANFGKPPLEYEVAYFKMRRRKPGSASSSGATSSLDIEAVGEPKPLSEDLSEIIPSNPKWARAIATGENPDDKDYDTRSELVFGGVKWMLAEGVDPGHILSILTDPGYGISAHVLEKPDPLTYAKRQVARAKVSLDEDNDKPDTDEKPEILVLPGRLPFAVDQAEQALIEAGVPIYQRYDSLVRTVRLPDGNAEEGIRRADGALILKQVVVAWLRERFAIVAHWVKLTAKNKKVPTDPPHDAASAYLARAGEWRVPFLQAITQIPTLRTDGTILQQPGYDAPSAILYDPGTVEFPEVPENPTKEQALEALETLARPFRDFCFARMVDRSVALAAVLTALVRRMFPSAPLFIIESPVAGTGKSLFCETLGIIAMGHKPAMMSQGKTTEEQEKRLSSVLMAGDPVIVIDNCDRTIEGDFLCSMLTQEWVQPRILGKSEVLRLPTKNLVLATGNNPEVAGDVSRRALKCRLDAHVERPDRIQYGFDPRDEAFEDRAKLVVAGLTVMRAYIAAGQPQELDKIGSFEKWNIVREALVWLGMVDPAEARDEIFENDPRKGELVDLLHLWWKVFKDRRLTLSELAAMSERGGLMGAAEVVTELTARTRYNVFNTRSIGRYLSGQNDCIAGGLTFRSENDPSGVKRYWVAKVEREEKSPPDNGKLPF